MLTLSRLTAAWSKTGTSSGCALAQIGSGFPKSLLLIGRGAFIGRGKRTLGTKALGSIWNPNSDLLMDLGLPKITGVSASRPFSFAGFSKFEALLPMKVWGDGVIGNAKCTDSADRSLLKSKMDLPGFCAGDLPAWDVLCTIFIDEPSPELEVTSTCC